MWLSCIKALYKLIPAVTAAAPHVCVVAVLGYRAAHLPVLAWLCLLPGSSEVCTCVWELWMQDWAGHLIQLLLFCASKFIFNPDCCLELDCCASTSSCAGGRSTLRLKQQHPSDCSSVILKMLLSGVESTIGKSLAFIC